MKKITKCCKTCAGLQKDCPFESTLDSNNSPIRGFVTKCKERK